MAISILIICFLLLIVLFNHKGIRQALIYTFTLMGVYAYATTELLSFFNALNFSNLFLLWLFFCLITVLLVFKIKINLLRFLYRLINSIKNLFLKSSFFQVFCLLFLFLILSTNLITALSVPTNNYDSMTYHLPRIEHWIQNKSIKFYPTNIERQLYMSPFAEIAILQVRLLSQNDILVNLIQWLAMFGSIVCVSLIAKYFGLNSLGQLTSSVFAITIPMGILQSTTTQNDYVGTFWAISTILFLLNNYNSNSSQINLIFSGLALGLSLLTKPTSFIFVAPFALFFIYKKLIARSYKGVIILISLVFLINIPHYYRNFQMFNSPLGPEPEVVGIGTYSPKYIFSNILKNMSVHFGTLNSKINAFANYTMENLHNIIGVDINDYQTTYVDAKFKIIDLSRSENYAGNPYHFFIIISATVFMILYRKFPKKVWAYLIISWSGFLILTALLRWQPWMSRLHLPFFVSISPLVGVLLSKYDRVASYILIFYLIYISFPYIFSSTKPLLGPNSVFLRDKDHIIFSDMPKELPVNRELVSYMTNNNLRNIGFCASSNSWEYHFWYMIREKYKDDFKFEHVFIKNASAKIRSDFKPQVLINCTNLDSSLKIKASKMFGNNNLSVLEN